MLLAHSMEYFKFLFFYFLIFPKGADKASNITNIISQSDAAECLYKDKDGCFIPIRSTEIAKPYCKHNIRPPVISPDIPNIPFRPIYPKLLSPIMLGIDLCHPIQSYGEKMGDSKICS